jgi:futalosine hydrolase
VSARICSTLGTKALHGLGALPGPLVYGPEVLVVAATPLELAFVERADTHCCGVGPVEAAATTARRLAEKRPTAVLHIGIAGARELDPGTLVLGSEAVYCDLVDSARTFPRIERAVPDPALLAMARAALRAALALPIATSARVGGGHACCEVEAMEGFAVLRAAADARIPALELRAISNRFDAGRADWRIDEAIRALAHAVPVLLEAFRA